MAMILDSFVSLIADSLGALIKEEATMLLGVKDELKRLERETRDIGKILEDAERKAIHDKAIQQSLDELRDVMYDADDIIDECRVVGDKRCWLLKSSTSTASVRCCSPILGCFSRIIFQHKIGSSIRTIIVRLDEISKYKSLQQLTSNAQEKQVSKISRQTSPLPEAVVVGRSIKEHTLELVDILTRDIKQRNPILAIVGVGGIGKTTLAKEIYNDKRIDVNFQIKMWVCVSQEIKEITILKEIISMAGGSQIDVQTRGQLETSVDQAVSGKKFFLVLDDVWDGRIWEYLLQNPLQNSAPGSWILVTTRNDSVAKQMGALPPYYPNLLSIEEGWYLLCNLVFNDNEEEEISNLKDIGLEIVKKCDGLPLAIKTVGGVLRTKDKNMEEWDRVLKNPAWQSLTDLPDGVMGALYLSYEDLPSHLKQCFLSSSLFPEDSVLIMMELVPFWIAEGFVKVEGSLSLEEVAEGYYRELVGRSLLQPDPLYYEDGGCRMHDLLRSLAQFLSRGENVFGDSRGLENLSMKPRRLSIAGFNKTTLPDVKIGHEYLRTLLLNQNPIKEIPEDLFDKLERLRVLNLDYTEIEKVPDSIGKLIHLRLLSLQITRIRGLPETLRNLRNLQSLDLTGCQYLQNLPVGITLLSNLRSLSLWQTPLKYIPTGIGGLKHLVTLLGFVANRSNHRNEWDSGRCGLEELKSLSQLQSLSIEKLEMAFSKDDARAAALPNKIHLKTLVLAWTYGRGDHPPYEEEGIIKRSEEVFKELRPPTCLHSLAIDGFSGLAFPSWMMMSSSDGTSLLNLRFLKVIDCVGCQRLPPLGQLRLLDCLIIKNAPAIERIGQEFFGGSSTHSSFPKLQILQIEEMPNWEEWCGMKEGDLPCLRELQLHSCPKLRALPEGMRHATALTELGVNDAGLRAIENLFSVKKLEISDCSDLKRVSNLTSLEELTIFNYCPNDMENSLNTLRHLKLLEYSEESLPNWLGPHTTGALEELEIQCNLGLLKRLWLRLTREVGDPMIKYIPSIHAYTWDKSKYIYYTKSPYSFQSSITGEEEELSE